MTVKLCLSIQLHCFNVTDDSVFSGQPAVLFTVMFNYTMIVFLIVLTQNERSVNNL